MSDDEYVECNHVGILYPCDKCGGPMLTPAAQAVLEAAVTWEGALTAMMPGLVVGDPMLADPLASRLYNAIRRYRETLPA